MSRRALNWFYLSVAFALCVVASLLTRDVARLRLDYFLIYAVGTTLIAAIPGFIANRWVQPPRAYHGITVVFALLRLAGAVLSQRP